MKKVLLITECLEKGVGKHVLDIYNGLKKYDDISIWIVYGKDRADINFVKKIDVKDAIEVKNLKRSIGFGDIKSFFEIRKIIKEIKPDIVHCHSSKAGFSARIAAKSCGTKMIIYSPHAYFFLKYKPNSIKFRIFVMAEKILSRYFTHKTITTSVGEDAAFLNNKVDNKDKRVLIEHGVTIKHYTEKELFDERKKYIVDEENILVGAMARFENQKDPIGTFKIMQEISKKCLNVKCVFWGNGSYYNEIKLMNEENDNMVFLPGETDTPDLNLACLDIYLTASLYEGLPYTLLTALGYGLPVVASNVEGNKDCVNDNVNGVLFEMQNYNEAVEKIKCIIENQSYKKMKSESFKIFNKRFSMNKMIENYRRLYLDE